MRTELACISFPLLPVSAGGPAVPPSPTGAYLIDWNIALTDEVFTSDIIEFPSHIMIGCGLVILAAGGNYYICFDPSIPRTGFLILTFALKVLIYHNVQQSVGFKRSYTTNLSQMLGISGQLERHHWKTWGGCIIGCLVVSKKKKKGNKKRRALAGHLSQLWEAPGADCGAL